MAVLQVKFPAVRDSRAAAAAQLRWHGPRDARGTHGPRPGHGAWAGWAARAGPVGTAAAVTLTKAAVSSLRRPRRQRRPRAAEAAVAMRAMTEAAARVGLGLSLTPLPLSRYYATGLATTNYAPLSSLLAGEP